MALPRGLKDDTVVLDFDGRTIESLAFSRKDLLATTDSISFAYGLHSQGWPDAMAIRDARAEH